jgi:hypothetical protein
MDREGAAETLFKVAAALIVALVFAPVVRTVTVELNHSVGRAWPFSLGHCHFAATPGCGVDEANVKLVAAPHRQASR